MTANRDGVTEASEHKNHCACASKQKQPGVTAVLSWSNRNGDCVKLQRFVLSSLDAFRGKLCCHTSIHHSVTLCVSPVTTVGVPMLKNK